LQLTGLKPMSRETCSMEDTNRSIDGLMRPLEIRSVGWLVRHLPSWVNPNLLTGLGMVGAGVVFLGYAMSSSSPEWLWLASAGFIINWFGDSLDGGLARYRKIQRPRFGFYLDNFADLVVQLIVAIAIARSGYIDATLSMTAFSLFLMISMLTLIRASVFGVVHLTYGKFGLTELRVIFIALNTTMYFFPPKVFTLFDLRTSYPNLLCALWICVLFATFLLVAYQDLRKLSLADPPPSSPL
jgi:archaetidylinositol phosphate synthase